MFSYFLKRLAAAIPVALAVTVICFLLVQIAPGDPLSLVLPSDATQEQIDVARAHYGLDKPLVVQYLFWLGNVLVGDFGTSIASGRPVLSEITNALVYSIQLAALASFISVVVGVFLGLIAGYKVGSWVDKIVSSIAIAGVSIPHYWLGIVLVVIFSAELNLLPAMGAARGEAPELQDMLMHMVLPVITLSAMPIGIIARSVRSLAAETLGKDFVVSLVARGLSDFTIFIHVFKNIAPTTLAVIGVQVESVSYSGELKKYLGWDIYLGPLLETKEVNDYFETEINLKDNSVILQKLFQSLTDDIFGYSGVFFIRCFMSKTNTDVDCRVNGVDWSLGKIALTEYINSISNENDIYFLKQSLLIVSKPIEEIKSDSILKKLNIELKKIKDKPAKKWWEIWR